MPRLKREPLSPDNEEEENGRGLQSFLPPGQNFAVVITKPPPKRPRLSEGSVGEPSSRSRATSLPLGEGPRSLRLSPCLVNEVQSRASSINTVAGGTIVGTSYSSIVRISSTTPASDPPPFSHKWGKQDIPNLNAEQKRLLFLRHTIQKRVAKVTSSGLDSLDANDVDTLKRTLQELSYHMFSSGDYKASQIGTIVKKLTKVANWGDDIANMAKMLYGRWAEGDFLPAPLVTEEEDLLSSDEDSELGDDGPAGTGHVRAPPFRTEFAKNLMRGIIRDTSGKRLVYKLNPNFPKRMADVFGNNGLKVGDYIFRYLLTTIFQSWWPYQICALRDGAHGSRMGGIYGRLDSGAFSIVVSGTSDYYDNDAGEEIQYAGSHGDPATRDDYSPQLTNATKTLTMSIRSRKPVRVIRKGPGGKYSPAAGFRYDGLYIVEQRSIVNKRTDGERDFYRFLLRRLTNQPSIDAGRPSKTEYSSWMQLTGQS